MMAPGPAAAAAAAATASRRTLNQEQLQELEHRGFTVISRFIGPDLAARARDVSCLACGSYLVAHTPPQLPGYLAACLTLDKSTRMTRAWLDLPYPFASGLMPVLRLY